MDSSKKTTAKLSKKSRFKGGLHRRIFMKINIVFITHMM